jgi:hypothetical protein
MPVPPMVLRLLYGRIADEALLASAHVVPAKLCAPAIPSGTRIWRMLFIRRLPWRSGGLSPKNMLPMGGAMLMFVPSYGENPDHF